MYGALAGAFTDGVKDGYAFVDKAKAAQDEAAKRKMNLEKQTMELDATKAIYQDAMGGNAGAQPNQDAMAEVQRVNADLQQQIKKSNGATMDMDINGISAQATIKERDEYLKTLNSKIKSNPAAYASLNLKGTVEVLNRASTTDMAWMTDNLRTMDISPESLDLDLEKPEDQELWSKVMDEAVNIFPYVKEGENRVNMDHMGIATGAINRAVPAMRKQLEENNDMRAVKLERIVQEARTAQDATAMGADAKGQEKALADNVEAILSGGEYTDPTPVSTDMVDPEATARINDIPEEYADKVTEEDYAQQAFVRGQEGADKVVGGRQANVPSSEGGMDAVTKFNQDREQGANYKGDPYTRWNKDDEKGGSGAYGKYQMMPATYTQLAKDLGMTEEQIRTPEGQEEAFKELTRQNSAQLKTLGVADTPANQYVMHQLGYPTAKKYFEGNIDKGVMSAMRNQFSGSKNMSDEQVLAKWNKEFATGGGATTTTASGTPKQAMATEVKQAVSSGKPMDTTRLKKLYAIAGKTYPKGTTKMENYDFIIEQGFTKDEAFDATFGKTTSSSKVGRVLDEMKKYKPGSTEHNLLKNYAKKLGRVGTASKYDRDTAIADNKRLMQKDPTKWTAEDKQDYASNIEVIQGYDTTAKEQNWDAETTKVKQGRQASQEAFKVLEGDKNNPSALGDLEVSQRILRQAQPKVHESEKDILKELRGNQTSMNQTTDILNRIEGGDLQNIERGAVDSLKKAISTKLDKKTTALMDKKTGGKWTDTSQANIKLDTSLGLLQAAFIKAISGATVTDEERRILVQTMVGGGGMDSEEALKTALTEFRSATVQKMELQGKQLAKGTSPYDGYTYSQVEELTSSKQGPVVHRGKKVVKTGVMDGKRVVQYEDGTTEVL